MGGLNIIKLLISSLGRKNGKQAACREVSVRVKENSAMYWEKIDKGDERALPKNEKVVPI